MRNPELMVVFIFFLFPLLLTTHACSSNFNQSLHQKEMQPAHSNQQTRFFRFIIQGNVVPDGLFVAILHVGQPPRVYHFDIDTGSDVTWIQCAGPDAHEAPNPPYTPHNNFLPRNDPLCITGASKLFQRDRCEFSLEYADKGMFHGSMVRDNFPFYDETERRTVAASLAFGCGTYVKPNEQDSLKFDGVLGLGKSRVSIPSQLKHLSLTKNVHGHCLSRRGRGFGFFGVGQRALLANAVWLPMQPSRHYVVGPATLSLDNRPPRINIIDITLDSGTTYTYFKPQIFRALYSMVQSSLSRTPLTLDHEDRYLPHCWKLNRGDITNIDQVKRYFKPIVLDFAGGKTIMLQPEDYLVVSTMRRVCFGILDSEIIGDFNLLGDVSMLEKYVVYDNERGLIGWFPVRSCAPPRIRSTENEEDIAFLEPGLNNTSRAFWSGI